MSYNNKMKETVTCRVFSSASGNMHKDYFSDECLLQILVKKLQKFLKETESIMRRNVDKGMLTWEGLEVCFIYHWGRGKKTFQGTGEINEFRLSRLEENEEKQVPEYYLMSHFAFREYDQESSSKDYPANLVISHEQVEKAHWLVKLWVNITECLPAPSMKDAFKTHEWKWILSCGLKRFDCEPHGEGSNRGNTWICVCAWCCSTQTLPCSRMILAIHWQMMRDDRPRTQMQRFCARAELWRPVFLYITDVK